MNKQANHGIVALPPPPKPSSNQQQLKLEMFRQVQKKKELKVSFTSRVVPKVTCL
jgi:hypothetical protein